MGNDNKPSSHVFVKRTNVLTLEHSFRYGHTWNRTNKIVGEWGKTSQVIKDDVRRSTKGKITIKT